MAFKKSSSFISRQCLCKITYRHLRTFLCTSYGGESGWKISKISAFSVLIVEQGEKQILSKVRKRECCYCIRVTSEPVQAVPGVCETRGPVSVPQVRPTLQLSPSAPTLLAVCLPVCWFVFLVPVRHCWLGRKQNGTSLLGPSGEFCGL